MANYMSNHSWSHYNHMSRFLDQECTAAASCYAVESSTSKVHGFHYCTTLGAGMSFRSLQEALPSTNLTRQEHSGVPEVPSGSKNSILSPPLERPAASVERSLPGNNRSEQKGEAMFTIPEECERLFCDTLSATFLGEGIDARQESLGMGAFQNQPSQIEPGHSRINKWVEVWDYSGDAIYRGFLTEMNGERTLFVFFEDDALGHVLKSGYAPIFSLYHIHTYRTIADGCFTNRLIALFELAGIDVFDCSQIVACVKRSEHTNEMELVRSLGWCGFSLTTLEPWASEGDSGPFFSTKWLFLAAEV
ncbi:hypothetical protein N7532_003389 [Penicillium argentinense]|uniref:Ornithine decarboxylase antizyme n=1 Tax=Penicillium argentinense TaxID=1131581 RepID=A0A9W9FMY1_9EURO|nr:uncharacterized protein N7532_003389 [Penicillium argentinense]KAJ5102860.1 hypothetical protein N7532_003389 [Penicillium argentinense]